MSDQAWERAALREILDEALRERRRARLWRIITRAALVVAILILSFSIVQCANQTGSKDVGPHTAEVRINEPIMSDTTASADQVIKGLNAAFDAQEVAGVVLRINTPGGSPVHSKRIYDEMMRLREEYPDTPLYAVIDDMGVSGGYYVASAAEKIFVGGSSVVGSIGVIAGSFGLEEAMDKLGIERRVHTAGENKAFLDPFSPLKEDHVDHLKLMLEDMHQQFIDAVRKGRGDRLKEDKDVDLFSGLVWTGARSIELGLADEIGSVSSVARNVIGEKKVVDYTAKRDFVTELSEQFGVSVGQGLYFTLKRLELMPN